MNLLLNIFLINILIDLVIGCIATADRFLTVQSGHVWRKWLWCILCIRLILPVSLSLDFFGVHWPEAKVSIDMAGILPDPPMSETTIYDSPEENFAEPHLTPLERQNAQASSVLWILIYAWAAGALLFLRFRMSQYFHTCKLYLETAVSCTDERLISLEKSVGNELGLRHLPELLIQDKIKSPMVFGYMHRKLLIPPMYSADELLYIMRHELTHVKKQDIWYKLLLILVCDIYWFNPMLRLMKKKAFLDVEYVCDENVIKNMPTDEKKFYAKVILRTVHMGSMKPLHLSTQFAASKSIAKKRLENLFFNHDLKKGYIILAVLIGLFILANVCIMVTDSNKTAVSPKEPAPIVENTEAPTDTEKTEVSSTAPPDKNEVLRKRDEIKDSVDEETYETIQNVVKNANLKLEHWLLYNNIFSRMEDPEDLVWNYIDQKGDIQIGWAYSMDNDADIELAQADPEQYATQVIAYNPYNGEDFINLMDELKAAVDHHELRSDFDRMISDMEHAMDTHDVVYIQDIYYTLHDMDYFLFRYGQEVGMYSIRDRSTVSKYYGVLNIYRNEKE